MKTDLETSKTPELPIVGKSIFRLPSEVQFGGVQKFVIAKSDAGLHFASIPGDAHPILLSNLEKEVGNKVESLGGAFLGFFEDEIMLDTSSKSLNIGPVKIPWSEVQKIVQNVVGEKYKVILSE